MMFLLVKIKYEITLRKLFSYYIKIASLLNNIKITFSKRQLKKPTPLTAHICNVDQLFKD